ncbi:MAG TPA: hypothetical protein VGE08_12960 [Steroidobacter sp.]|uniref:hypothetical protein n=1 Tax=Steroidobacter sp. TaxID=1978227 RepID=UPI002EDA5509
MPSHLHEALLELFRGRPELAPELVQTALRVQLPRYADARIHAADLTEIRPVEYRADLVVLLQIHSEPVFGIIVEVQLSSDPRKRYVWPLYAASLRAQLECPVQVLVVTDDDTVATWAAQPIDIGCGNMFTPLVIGPSGVPEIVDDEQAQADPELAVLSAMAHGHDEDVTKAARIALVAQRVCSNLDNERAGLYLDLIYLSLSEAARRALQEMLPANYEYQSDFARKFYGQGKTEGRAEGRAEGSRERLISLIAQLLGLRFGPLDEVTLSRIAATSSAELEKVAERLLSAPTLAAALGDAADQPEVNAAK